MSQAVQVKVKEHPIIFTGESVRAILEGHKTQTRRVIDLHEFRKSSTPGYDWTFRGQAPVRSLAQQKRHAGGCWQDLKHDRFMSLCPYGKPGDRLWVREAAWVKHETDGDSGATIDCGPYWDSG